MLLPGALGAPERRDGMSAGGEGDRGWELLSPIPHQSTCPRVSRSPVKLTVGNEGRSQLGQEEGAY